MLGEAAAQEFSLELCRRRLRDGIGSGDPRGKARLRVDLAAHSPDDAEQGLRAFEIVGRS
jgi:hypothetical protein